MLRTAPNLLHKSRSVVALHLSSSSSQPQNGARRRLLSSAKAPPTPTATGAPPVGHPGVGKMMSRADYLKLKKAKGIDKHNTSPTEQDADGKTHFLRAGLPFLLFSLGAFWVVASAIDGKLKEKAASRREVSQSERQALMEDEHDTMMDKLNKAAKKDFDNTKRIERPEDILARRKAEREKRNVWYRRYWRYIKGEP